MGKITSKIILKNEKVFFGFQLLDTGQGHRTVQTAHCAMGKL